MTEAPRVITAKLPGDLISQLDDVCERIDRSKSWVVRRALAEWLVDEQLRHEAKSSLKFQRRDAL
jgi:predicted transcriptional regulator